MFLPEWELMGLPGWNHEDGRFRSLGKLIFRSSFLSKFNLDSGFGIPQSNLEFVIFRQFKKT
ncbi:hypothetical protein C5O10_05915 [Akkermansia muciniphila]|nr:hypothetical protein C5O09_05880 [Akkermansia muciniphila]QHV16382.1 hypothetical protein C5O10_05915 [Akkermansia muciniphila]QHV32618.1 hypothetical protein C5O17_06255 [Akkermansia muciniphila]